MGHVPGVQQLQPAACCWSMQAKHQMMPGCKLAVDAACRLRGSTGSASAVPVMCRGMLQGAGVMTTGAAMICRGCAADSFQSGQARTAQHLRKAGWDEPAAQQQR